jgi:hypothetical protein
MSTYNQANLQVDLRLWNALAAVGLNSNQIAVITPYKEQQRLLVRAIGKAESVGTVDSFQGQERDLVILDLVRANPDRQVGFTLEPNRLNVALSRAKQKLIIITNLQTFQGHPLFDLLLQRIQNLPHTQIEHMTANQLNITLPTYKPRAEIRIIPDMSHVAEPENTQPPAPITPPGDYFDVY